MIPGFKLFSIIIMFAVNHHKKGYTNLTCTWNTLSTGKILYFNPVSTILLTINVGVLSVVMSFCATTPNKIFLVPACMRFTLTNKVAQSVSQCFLYSVIAPWANMTLVNWAHVSSDIDTLLSCFDLIYNVFDCYIGCVSSLNNQS